MTDTEPDARDPGELRHCLIPACKASFNIVLAYEGKALVSGWRQCTVFSLDYLCPEHSHLWAEPAHAPQWVIVDGKVTGCRCAGCDNWLWLPAAPTTAGQYRDRYVTHLVAVLAALGAVIDMGYLSLPPEVQSAIEEGRRVTQ